MTKPAVNWDDLRIALEIARHRSLSAAARSMGYSQPTLSRRLEAFEAKLGVVLFERGPTGLKPTPLCHGIVDSLSVMEDAAFAAEQRIQARDQALEGKLVVTSVDWLGDDVVAPILALFSLQHPLVEVELVNEGRHFNLARGEADIAVRFGGFVQKNLHQRKIADIGYGLYSSPDYLTRHGTPDFGRRGADHRLAVLSELPGRATLGVWLSRTLPAAKVTLRSSSMRALLSVVQTGAAVAALPRVLGDARSDLVRIATPGPPFVLSIRLGVLSTARAVPRVRAAIDFIGKSLAHRREMLCPT